MDNVIQQIIMRSNFIRSKVVFYRRSKVSIKFAEEIETSIMRLKV